MYNCERLASFYSVCCINLSSGVSKTVHFGQSEMCRMFLFVVLVFGIQQYRIFRPNISIEYAPMAERTSLGAQRTEEHA